MTTTNDLRNGMYLRIDGKVCEVTYFQHVKPGKGGAFVRTKLRDVVAGRTREITFNAGTKVEEAYIERKSMEYLYRDGSQYYFMDKETYEQLPVAEEKVSELAGFLKENEACEFLLDGDKILGISLPNFVALKVVETEPGFKGDTQSSVMKPARLETGAEIQVPLFIEVGETLKIDTRDGRYVERL